MRSLELFAGAGGLAIGMANAGFRHAAVVEWDHDACQTFRENQTSYGQATENWPVIEADARLVDYRALAKNVHVVSGGPPCQPFSMGGKHKAQKDGRDMFPEAVRAVRELMPKAFVFENVKGLMRESFSTYFSYIHLQLQHPEVERRKGESWLHHRSRLERHHMANKDAPTYNVLFELLNAADFGVPQKRERVFFVGFRSDLGAQWEFPTPTHSENALLTSKWIDGSYWARHGIRQPAHGRPTSSVLRRIEALAERSAGTRSLPWKTTRDALKGLPDPEVKLENPIPNHTFVPGARSYVGHTGSLLDEPSKTLKAGAHGVPGGENMFVKDSGAVRYFTVREAARIQTFPDNYRFHGSWGQAMRQLGNAVPVKLAETVARSVANTLSSLK